jgi:hypothetical protein
MLVIPSGMTKIRIIFYPMLPDFRKSNAMFHGSPASAACPYDMCGIRVSEQHCWNILTSKTEVL